MSAPETARIARNVVAEALDELGMDDIRIHPYESGEVILAALTEAGFAVVKTRNPDAERAATGDENGYRYWNPGVTLYDDGEVHVNGRVFEPHVKLGWATALLAAYDNAEASDDRH